MSEPDWDGLREQLMGMTMAELQAENERLRTELADERAEVEWAYEFMGRMAERIRGDADAHNLVDYVRKLMDENAELREQLERLVTLLRNDCDIDASWDGLRRFWCIQLTENGCLMRDRACKAEAENERLRELVRDMWNEGMCECGSRGKCARCEYDYPDRMRELGVEVDS